MKTNRDLVLSEPASWGALKVPAGAAVIFVKGQGGGYALRDPKQYGMNLHDAKYRYAWVPADAVEGAGK